MVECGRLEICCTLSGTGGSNPSLSATFPQEPAVIGGSLAGILFVGILIA